MVLFDGHRKNGKALIEPTHLSLPSIQQIETIPTTTINRNEMSKGDHTETIKCDQLVKYKNRNKKDKARYHVKAKYAVWFTVGEEIDALNKNEAIKVFLEKVAPESIVIECFEHGLETGDFELEELEVQRGGRGAKDADPVLTIDVSKSRAVREACEPDWDDLFALYDAEIHYNSVLGTYEEK